ncbi:Por secretion system C-terminal sorting domain-containing protein [Chishuiella changwenlii]|uniref:Por secretion system C-terminal sorting domain-containing protein n=2 Tax=Chishuiella changwenlii TaxID=1434701 RepID=A0A1M7BSD7_9FLAO|nr:T9SS type A sorting domain-containing protein [Chishuiella changwenlii]SHL57864.1 Por secretion system C-terminal sorting domain-containing protein [Chishuiella changwenlii]
MRIKLLSVCSLFLMISLSAQEVVWEKSIGGEHAEYLYNAIPTPDYGFLILGSSASDATGDIKKNNQGSLDYFLWKMDENGKQEWQNSFGGSGTDFLYAAKPTPDGGYILAGASTSGKSGDKTSENQGAEDIWIIKIDANGNLQWQQTFGGNGNDIPTDILVTEDGGYLIAANSNSTPSELKKSENFGGNDYYMIKLDKKGQLIWEKTFGGAYDDKVKSILQTKDGFILVGNSNSPASGNKTVEQTGNKTWIVEIDNEGNIRSENSLGLSNENYLISAEQKEDQYLFAINEKNGNKVTSKVIETDLSLQSIKTTELKVENNLSITEIKNVNDSFLLTANKISSLQEASNGAIESYYITKSFDKNGTSIWEKKFGEKGFNYLEKAITTRDGSTILFGNSTQQAKGNKGQSDFYLVKLGKEGDDVKRVSLEVYPNPTSDIVNVIINKEFTTSSIEVYNLAGQHLQNKDVKYRSTPISLGGYPGGVYILKIKTDNKSESIKIIKK